MRVALFGSPQFAATTLQTLHTYHEVILVVTQPDKAVGRGHKLASPAAATEAKRLGLRLEQPTRLKKNEAFHSLVEKLNLDVAVTAAYGKILPETLLELPKHGFLNVHGSLLPKYRGAAPIQWALINGEAETGISIMQTEVGLDTGPVRHVKKLRIEPDDTSLTLFEKLAELGSVAIIEALELLENGKLPSEPQDESKATHAPMLSKEDGQIDWRQSAQAIYNRFRGVYAWPGSWTLYNGSTLKVHALELTSGQGNPGEVLSASKVGIEVATGKDALLLKQVQPPNKPKMTAYDWANGYHVKGGERLG